MDSTAMDSAAMDSAAMDSAAMDSAAMDSAAMDSAAMDSAAMDREAFVDLGAITANVAALCELVRGRQVLAAVKADGYGHGMVPAARAALAGGAAWLGVADLGEAVALRRAGITAPVLCMMTFGDPAE